MTTHVRQNLVALANHAFRRLFVLQVFFVYSKKTHKEKVIEHYFFRPIPKCRGKLKSGGDTKNISTKSGTLYKKEKQN